MHSWLFHLSLQILLYNQIEKSKHYNLSSYLHLVSDSIVTTETPATI